MRQILPQSPPAEIKMTKQDNRINDNNRSENINISEANYSKNKIYGSPTETLLCARLILPQSPPAELKMTNQDKRIKDNNRSENIY